MVRRLTSLVTVLALSGSPAAVSACLAACLQGVPMAAMVHDRDAAPEHAGHAPTAPPAAVSAHAHHASAVGPEPVSAAVDDTSSRAGLTAGCGTCCPDARVAFASGPGVERTDARTFGWTPMPTPLAPFLQTASVRRATALSPPLPPRSPARAPLVLRI